MPMHIVGAKLGNGQDRLHSSHWLGMGFDLHTLSPAKGLDFHLVSVGSVECRCRA